MADVQILMDLWNWIVTNWLGIIVGAIITLVSSYVFYLKSIKTLKPCYASHSTNVINEKASKIDRLKIYYCENGKSPDPNDKTLDNFTISYIPFWNHGDNAIRSEDISPNKPITLIINDGYRILDAIKIKETSDNGFTLTKINENSYKISFIYLNKAQGALIKVFHDGKSDNDISITGDLIDCKGIKKVDWDGSIKNKKSKNNYTLKDIALIGIVLIFAIGMSTVLMWILLTISVSLFSTMTGLISPIANNSTSIFDPFYSQNKVVTSISYGIIGTVFVGILALLSNVIGYIRKWNTPQVPEELTIIGSEN